MLEEPVAAICLIWYAFIVFVCAIGVYQIRRNYVSIPRSSAADGDWPHITIIRPVKGIEPCLYQCLASTFNQEYPPRKVTTFFCVPSRQDPAFPILERVLAIKDVDAQILVEDEDPKLRAEHGQSSRLGPNPKIRNMSRAYREAKGDIVWIIDCNVWVAPSTASRMVALLTGISQSKGKKYKFVHQLPLAMDITPTQSTLAQAGGKLEEMFLSTSHAKFYTAINTVAIAPCIVGKSNMFRRSHLNALTDPASPLPVKSTASVPEAQQLMPGIDYFSSNICEDHLIGDLLWKNPVPASVLHADLQTNSFEQWGNHALLPPHPSNLAIQPISNSSVPTYISRRVRWLRVRKFTVILATLVEPGTESILCSLYGAYAFTTLPFFNRGVPGQHSWIAFWAFFAMSLTVWACVDRWVWLMLQSNSDAAASFESGDPGAKSASDKGLPQRRRSSVWHWLPIWLGREALAFPIWAWAIFGGVSVVWRDRQFRVGTDMRVREIVRGHTRTKGA